MFSLAIVYTPKGGRPLRVACISDRDLLRRAAAAAILQAEREIAVLEASDYTLGRMQSEEAAKLRRVLGLFLSPLQ